MALAMRKKTHSGRFKFGDSNPGKKPEKIKKK